MAILAFSGSRQAVEQFRTRGGTKENEARNVFIDRLHDWLQERVTLHDTYLKTVLCGMSNVSFRIPNECSLALLNQGTETSLVYKQQIAEYLGVVTSWSKVDMFRRAIDNMTR